MSILYIIAQYRGVWIKNNIYKFYIINIFKMNLNFVNVIM